MSKTETKKQAKAAEFPDDAEFEIDLDHDADDAFVVRGGDPNFHYFLAANDGDRDRPDGVAKCKAMGYKECTEEEVLGGADCILLKIPRKVFEARRKRKRDARIAAKKGMRIPKNVPKEFLVELEKDGQRGD